MSDRKYRQPGYMDSGDNRRKDGADRDKAKIAGPSRSQNNFGPRVLNMPGTRTVSRCAQCGVLLPEMTETQGQCSKCGFPLHSCKQCAHFDPASRFECSQAIPVRVAKKDVRNDCQFYSLKVMVEKETSTAGMRADDARRAFENLFKK